MVSNQVLGARVAAGLLALLVMVSGCSSLHSSKSAGTAAPGAPVTASTETQTTPADDMTATEAAASRAASPATVESAPAADAGNLINPSAPKSYTVKRGDTLWGISSLFLRDPWVWPEVWYINPQVANPHLIYPGDTLALAFGKDGQPQIRLEHGGPARLDPRLRSTPGDGAIPTIAYSAIAAFLSRPTVLTSDQIKAAPYVLAFRDEHTIGGAGHEIYVRNLNAAQNTRFSVMHVGEPLRDPDDGKVIGYEGIYTATALVSQPGDPTKALLTDTARETLQGDRLLSTEAEVPLNFMLRAPRNDVHGRIISVVDGTHIIGQYQVVVLNRGKRHGVDAGHVLAVDQAGTVIPDRYAGGRIASRWGRMSGGGLGTSFAPKVALPDERAGTILVFKAFDRMSYGLIVGASSTIHVYDVVHNP
jgi:hypothetical protein